MDEYSIIKNKIAIIGLFNPNNIEKKCDEDIIDTCYNFIMYSKSHVAAEYWSGLTCVWAEHNFKNQFYRQFVPGDKIHKLYEIIRIIKNIAGNIYMDNLCNADRYIIDFVNSRKFRFVSDDIVENVIVTYKLKK